MTDRTAGWWLLGGIACTLVWLAAEITVPMTPRFLLACVALAAVWRAFASRDGVLHPIALYLAISTIYVLAAPLEVAMLGNRLDLDPLRMASLGDAGVLFLVLAGLGYAVLSSRQAASSIVPTVSLDIAKAAVGVCVLMLCACLAMTLQRYGTGIGTLTRAEIYANEYVALSLLRGQLALGLGVSAALVRAAECASGAIARGPRAALLATLTVYALTDLAILGDRRMPLAAVLAVAAIMLPRRISWRVLVGFAAGIALLTLYGFVRNTPPGQWLDTLGSGELVVALSPAAQEFGGMAIIGGALESLERAPPGFPTYDQALLQIIPRALVSERPLSPTEWFVGNYYPALAEIGASFAFNAVIEALLNGGLPMVAGAGLVTGALLALVSGIRWRGAPVGVAVAVFVFTFSMRMDLASQIRTALVAAVGLAVLATAIALFHGARQPAVRLPEAST